MYALHPAVLQLCRNYKFKSSEFQQKMSFIIFVDKLLLSATSPTTMRELRD